VSSRDQLLSAAAERGVHHIPLPTPFPVGDVNTFLVEGDAPVLFDCGPNSGTALGSLETQLRALGYALDDLGMIVFTHHHGDHVGLGAEIVRRTAAPVACLDLCATVLEDWETWAAQEERDVFNGLLRHGVPRPVALATRAAGSDTQYWTASVATDRRLTDGDTLTAAGRALTALHRPGHSQSDTVFLDAAAKVAIVGDHLLAAISSNAIVARPVGDWDGRRPKTLLTYRDSLRKTRELDFEIALTGHGDPLSDHRTLIDSRLAEQEERAESFLEQLSAGPMTAHELALARWKDTASAQAFACISDVLGHLDLLIDAGEVVEHEEGGLIRFETAA
jgi:glyoxylase-like metal-dependent hydrolase (beta-lactamase superfamily II)